MENFTILIALVCVLALFGLLALLISRLLVYAAKTATAPARNYIFYSMFPNMDPPGFNTYSLLLDKKIPFFRILNDKEQRLFVSRLRHIRSTKNFVGRGITITEEMEVLFSASLTQLTFGLTQFDLPDLYEIHFTPESFYSRLVDRNVKGLTFESGRIMLSWADFEHGYLVPNDQFNLGLHELAHALWLYHAPTSSIEEHFDEWHVEAVRELQKMRSGGKSFLRNYASTNIEEFWACSVECFFETPVEFREAIPVVYQKTSSILNQDMATRYQRYAPGQRIQQIT